MIRSMTGFGRGRYEVEGREYLVEIKSVNHKYNDISIRIPKTLNSLHTNKISSLNETKDTHFHNISETLSSSISSKDSIKYVKYIHYAFILFSINQLHLISNNTSQCNNKAKSKHYIYNI